MQRPIKMGGNTNTVFACFFLHFMYLFCLCFCVCGHICVTAHMWSQFSHSLTWVLGIELGSVAFIPLSRLGSQPSFRFFRQVVQADTSAWVLGFHGCATLKGFILFLSLVCIFLIPITQISWLFPGLPAGRIYPLSYSFRPRHVSGSARRDTV